MSKITAFIRSQPVLTAALAAAVITVFLIPPDREYLSYINFSVLIELFSLMTAIAGLRTAGIFEKMTAFLLKKAGNIRTIGAALTLLCFFSAMAVTNDVALLTFVPLTLLVFGGKGDDKELILTIVLETAAANLGGMLTPVGNPQNLFIYEKYGLTAGEFAQTMLPTGGICLAVMLLLLLLLPAKKAAVPEQENTPIVKKTAIACSVLFLVCLLTVFKVIPDILCLAAAVITALAVDRKMLAKVDYSLIATFVFFFVFVGNIARIDAVRELFSEILPGKEIIVSALLSQVISNVPAAVMLSGFTGKGTELLLGVNIGGFGTLIASLASLISFQLYRKTENAQSGRYMLVFSAVNFGMLIFLLILHSFVL